MDSEERKYCNLIMRGSVPVFPCATAGRKGRFATPRGVATEGNITKVGDNAATMELQDYNSD